MNDNNNVEKKKDKIAYHRVRRTNLLNDINDFMQILEHSKNRISKCDSKELYNERLALHQSTKLFLSLTEYRIN